MYLNIADTVRALKGLDRILIPGILRGKEEEQKYMHINVHDFIIQSSHSGVECLSWFNCPSSSLQCWLEALRWGLSSECSAGVYRGGIS